MTASPTFVATFADGVVTRMTTFCSSDKKLDMTRGVLLARHAYRQRTGREPVALTKAHFERDGTTLQAYSAIELDDTQARPAAAPDNPIETLVWTEKEPDKRYEADGGDAQPYVIKVTSKGYWNVRQGAQHIATVQTVEQAKAKADAYRSKSKRQREAVALLLEKGGGEEKPR